MSDGLTITSTGSLTPGQVTAATALMSAASGRDGFSGLNEAALLHLQHSRPGVQHLLAFCKDELVGYAQLEEASAGGHTTAQLVVHPDRRRRGVGSAVLDELLRLSPAPLQIWAMGHTSAAQALAVHAHLVVARVLLVLTRSLTEPVAPAPLPAGTTIRTFVLGQDEDAWLRVNARAFVAHPEQGRLTRADLEERIAQPWFDPLGFFLALRDGAVVGFHWTKQHPRGLGEVYVLGVDPDAGGRGLGKALLSRGLDHLRDRGNTNVELYVEGDHERAVGLYTRYGFAEASRDVMYAQPELP